MSKLLILLFCVVSASIKGPSEFKVGQLAVIDGSESVGDRMQWVIPPEFRSLPSASLKLGLTCDKPGTYVLMLVSVDKELEIATATHKITVTNGE